MLSSEKKAIRRIFLLHAIAIAATAATFWKVGSLHLMNSKSS